jgi:uncharacterized caspase-like protein
MVLGPAPDHDLFALSAGSALWQYATVLWDFTMRPVAAFACAVAVTCLGVGSGYAEKRVALVIGNSAYSNVARLDNPANDAKLLSETLSALGFTLVGGGAQLDLDKASLDRAVRAFGAQLSGADVGLFYYAGHGVQVRGENYLIPVDANPTKEADVDFQMLDTNLVLRQMEGAGARLNIVILDACRNNPFGGRSLAVARAQDTGNSRLRDTTGGLAQMQAPEGTLISFATQPGSVAQDGADGNSPYARALADTIRKPGLGIFDAFNQVGLQVKRATGGAQQPWVSSSPIDGSFYFVSTPAAASTVAPPPSLPPQAQTRVGSLTQAPAASDVRRFDGTWVVTWVCESTSSLPEIKGRFIGKASNGMLRSEVGTEGNPGWSRWNGSIESDGSITIKAEGLTGGTTETDPFHRPPGTKLRYTMIGTLEGTSGVATRADRDCNVKLAKQSVAALSPAATSSDVRRFDGVWAVDVACKKWGALPDFKRRILATISNGVFRGQQGLPGSPGRITLEGTIEADGAMRAFAEGISGADLRPPSVKFSYTMIGRLEGTSGTGTRDDRDCDVKFTRQVAGQGSR